MVPAGAEQLMPQIAVLVPCYNEEAAIATVVRDFRAALPDATATAATPPTRAAMRFSNTSVVGFMMRV